MNLYEARINRNWLSEEDNEYTLTIELVHGEDEQSRIDNVYHSVINHLGKTCVMVEATKAPQPSNIVDWDLHYTNIIIVFRREMKRENMIKRNLLKKVEEFVYNANCLEDKNEENEMNILEKMINFVSNEAKQITSQEVKNTTTHVNVKSACVCSPHRKDLVAVYTVDNRYCLVKADNYYNSYDLKKEGCQEIKAYFIGEYVEINKDWFYLTTTEGYTKEAFEECFDMSEKEYNLVMDWFKALQLEEKEEITFNPENTAIDTRHSKSADLILDHVEPNAKVLDYGCGTGRNMKHILNNAINLVVDGTDIAEQLKKEEKKHDQLREKGCTITGSEDLENNWYDVALNSHVLNVVESDEVKAFILKDIHKKLKSGGKAIIEVRTKSDVEGAKTKEPYGNGWKIKKGSSYTYQEAITKEKMVELATNAGFKIVNHICNSSQHIITLEKQ